MVIREPYDLVSEPYADQREPSGTEYIRWVQHCLNRTLGLQLPLTGVPGPDTRSAIRSFQRQQGLAVTGIADSDTKGQLMDTCGGQQAEENSELESSPLRVPGLLAWLTWQPRNEAPKLYTWDEIQKSSPVSEALGCYIVVLFERKRANGKIKKILKNVLKVGVTGLQTFRKRLNQEDHQKIRDESKRRWPDAEVGYYLATIEASNACPVAGCGNLVERLIARTLIRARYPMNMGFHEKPTRRVKPTGKIQVANILPKPLLGNLAKAYMRTPKDTLGQTIQPVTRPPTSKPAHLIVPQNAIWELEDYRSHLQ